MYQYGNAYSVLDISYCQYKYHEKVKRIFVYDDHFALCGKE